MLDPIAESLTRIVFMVYSKYVFLIFKNYIIFYFIIIIDLVASITLMHCFIFIHFDKKNILKL